MMSFSVFSQNYWHQSKVGDKEFKKNKIYLKNSTPFFTLNVSELQQELEEVRQRDVSADFPKNTIISLPNELGEMTKFYVAEASNFTPYLQAKYPDIRAYRGIGVKDPSISLSFSLSSELGLKAMFLTPGKPTVFIGTVTKDNSIYAIYHKKNKNSEFECRLPDELSLEKKIANASSTFNADDQVLRTFRLAVSVTAEYTQYFGGSKEEALAGINATITRVNTIFERDFAINMVLIDNVDEIIYTNPNSDPYSSVSQGGNPHPIYGSQPYFASNWTVELQETLTEVIGEENYDIGHLFGSAGSGGNAGCIGCVCETNFPQGKGSAYTSPSDGIPEDDTFDIDFVAHEMGHQFGANHTFSKNEFTGVAMEPGSGSTIMGYAGITGPTDIQANSDDFFHYISIQQVTNNIVNKDCATETSLVNTPPNVDAGANYTIPSGTAFKLTAEGNDLDGDPVTYSWEQGDASSTLNYSFPDPNSGAGPLFRVNQPVISSERYFPSFDLVLNGELYSTWETVSDVSREMNFTVQVRDNNVNVGQTTSDDVKITVIDDNGPFQFSNIAYEQSFASDGVYTLNWDVAGTNLAPFNSPNVNILFSNDGGDSFTILKNNTPNDGSEEVIIPEDSESQTAYFMIESVESIFYAVSPKVLVDFSEICETYQADINFPVNIDDGSDFSSGETLVIPFHDIPELGELNDVNVSIEIEHSYIGDLIIVLQSPDETQTYLWNRDCGNYQNLNITFDDDGSQVECGSPAVGIFLPSDRLSDLNGQSTAGTWYVLVVDNVSGDTGRVLDARIEVCGAEDLILDTDEEEFENEIKIYPNPTKGLVNIDLNNSLSLKKSQLNLFDLLGRKVKSKSLIAKNSELNISDLPSGVYLLEIESDGNKITRKIIKQ
ncbi:zinc-dependent metalloprotease [Mesonia aestuariivivens]|uniref:T9SS type A sorting domain-containing protein n=1 Tax=Mesonia aestuariivivens TaxID=2796128 RepID=A0ABS6VXJ8_9FLAO|nr:M12 family metallo-peptidase [Mesonia aestuariivivens]MBW2960276.1 T9SS type A sorting domain-containing protein [Mesonia aestuariivivens]